MPPVVGNQPDDLIPDKVPIENAQIGDIVLDTKNLSKHYEVEGTSRNFSTMLGLKETVALKANQELNLSARHGETLAIVGESGCGKSTFAKFCWDSKHRPAVNSHTTGRK
ncbi:MAG: hypothetical protein CM1200mP39_25440 [Dehalococcoidia bacterium]|nr:MAG: hypothetical protein CM1200mP39_25440 [Dehalococcoidia bacterium]